MTVSLEDLFGKPFDMKPFEPCAVHNESLDWLTWLDKDVTVVTERVHPLLELLRDGSTGEIIGFKILEITSMLKSAGM